MFLKGKVEVRAGRLLCLEWLSSRAAATRMRASVAKLENLNTKPNCGNNNNISTTTTTTTTLNGLSRRPRGLQSSSLRVVSSCTSSSLEWAAEIDKEKKEKSGDGPAPPLPGGLYVVATPIGNLGDFTFRALQVLRGCDEILCEDTRRTMKLLSHFGLRGKRLSSYHEHNKKKEKHKLTLEGLRFNSARSVALVCDAGTPTISDPGSELVHMARQLGIKVHCIPGACAFAAALSASGITKGKDDREEALDVHFVGFLPEKNKLLKGKLARMSEIPAIHVIYSAPHDLLKQLKAMKEVFSGERTQVVLAREITKMYEEFWRGTLSEAISEFSTNRIPKGEFTVLVENKTTQTDETKSEALDLGDAERVLSALIDGGMPASEAASLLVRISQRPLKKKPVYNAAVKAKQSKE